MPEEKKDQPTNSPADAEKALLDRIAAGVTAGVAASIPKIVEQIGAKPSAVPAPRQEPAAQLTRPSEEEIADAMVEGNKAKVADLLRRQRAYDQQENRRELGNLSTQGGAAISAIARNAAASLPYYKRFKKEIDQMVEGYLAANPGAIATPEMYERAHDIVRGQHTDELIEEAREEAIRKAREPEPDLLPEGRRAPGAAEPEPTSLAEVLAGDWKKEFRVKQRETGGRTDDEELRKMGYRGGFKEFIADRKQVESLDEETRGTFGLDRDWVWTDKAKGEGRWVN